MVPSDRIIRVLFEDITPNVGVFVYANGELLSLKKTITDCAAVEFAFKVNDEYLIRVEYEELTEWQKVLDRALNVLRSSEAVNKTKQQLWSALRVTTNAEEYISVVEGAEISSALKLRLRETL